MSPPILFIHGTFSHGGLLAPWVRYFEAAGYQCQAPSLPGRLPTDPDRLRELTMSDCLGTSWRVVGPAARASTPGQAHAEDSRRKAVPPIAQHPGRRRVQRSARRRSPRTRRAAGSRLGTGVPFHDLRPEPSSAQCGPLPGAVPQRGRRSQRLGSDLSLDQLALRRIAPRVPRAGALAHRPIRGRRSCPRRASLVARHGRDRSATPGPSVAIPRVQKGQVVRPGSGRRPPRPCAHPRSRRRRRCESSPRGRARWRRPADRWPSGGGRGGSAGSPGGRQ